MVNPRDIAGEGKKKKKKKERKGVSPPEREGTVMKTLMSVLSVSRGSSMSGGKGERVPGQSAWKQ